MPIFMRNDSDQIVHEVWAQEQASSCAVASIRMARNQARVVKGQNLVRPMITGWKRLPQSVPAPPLAGTLRAALVLGGCALAVAALVRFL